MRRRNDVILDVLSAKIAGRRKGSSPLKQARPYQVAQRYREFITFEDTCEGVKKSPFTLDQTLQDKDQDKHKTVIR
jgi:hypothetical protein